MKPLFDYVIAKRSESEEKSKGGIVIPDQARKKLNKGTIVHVGPGKLMEDRTPGPMVVKVGQTILFGDYSGLEFEHESEKYLAIRQDDIIAILD